MRSARALVALLGMVPVALPGLVLGLAYVFFFSDARNPLSGLYGGMTLLVLSNVVHFFTVGFLTASAALRQLDPELEAVSASLRVPFWRSLRRVTVPLCLPAILEIGQYYFVNSMVTVSAVIFLYGPRTRLASVAVVNLDEAGDTAAAAAMSMLIVATSLGARLIYALATRGLERRTQAWRKPEAAASS
jgi:iron(III) transport system permease protein